MRSGRTMMELMRARPFLWALRALSFCASRSITSSSDDKLERCRQLGAAYTVNYRRDPDWVATLLAQTGVRGADVVIDTVGLGAIEQTLSATAPNGRIALIGGLAGAAGTAPNMFGLIGKNLTLKGITSGSRAMLTELLDLDHVERRRWVSEIAEIAPHVLGQELL